MSDDHKLQDFVIGPIDDGVPSDGVASKFGSEDSPQQPDLTAWISSATGHDADQTAARLTGEGEKPPRAPDTTSMIYVDYSVPATFRYAETSVSYSSLREATTAWLQQGIELLDLREPAVWCSDAGRRRRFRFSEIVGRDSGRRWSLGGDRRC